MGTAGHSVRGVGVCRGARVARRCSSSAVSLVPSWCFVHAHVLWLLADNDLGKEGAVALAPHLGKLVKLTSLSLAFGDIQYYLVTSGLGMRAVHVMNPGACA